ncbi:MAG TPA: glycosyltransferase 87 family protein [Mycobacterium sp.]
MSKQRVAWRVFQLLAAAAYGYAAWRLLGHTPYRIDIDVYRMGGRAWLDGQSLYTADVSFHTQAAVDLPFTYPPLAAIVFAPFALLSLPAASAAITATTLVLLVVSTVIVLTRLDVWDGPGWAAVTREPAWLRRSWLALAIVAPAAIYLEPIRANFDFGQINVVLMTLVLADTVPRRTPWPRGLLLGLAIALKLTPAVFLLYFVVRRDGRAVLTALVSFVGATLLGVALAWRDSWEYWTTTIRDTDRIGTATLNTNQNIAGTLARLGLTDGVHFAVWTVGCFAALGLTVWATRRLLRAAARSKPEGYEPVLALICVALFGLVVSPVSWSHHWVWTLPTLVVTTVLAYRRRNVALAVVTAVGVALMVWKPILLMPEHREAEAALWRQFVGASYLWWAVAVILIAGLTAARPGVSPPPSAGPGPAAGPQQNPKPALHPL